MPQIIAVVGQSGSGKTTLLEKLIAELRGRFLRVGIIKHAFHGFDVDNEGTDSWRHRHAGANAVMVATKGQICLVRDHDGDEGDLDGFAAYFSDMDLVIAEGYKTTSKPKIEVFRKSVHKAPACMGHESTVAFVTDSPLDVDTPLFGLDDIEKLADFIVERFI